MIMHYALGLLPLLFIYSEGVAPIPLNPMRGAKCLIPKSMDHATRTIFLQQCISANYAQGNETRFYPELGYFTMDAPWTSLLRPLPTPLPPAEVDTTLFCYTKDSDKEYEIELWPEISLKGCPFSAKRKTIFITHGFASNGKFEWLLKMKNRLLDVEDANIFVVDWGRGAELMNYLQVSSNTRIVGAEGGRFIEFLIDKKGLTPDNLHLIGHSLGAQISSYFAKRVKEHKGLVGRITALDPAQPAFEGEDPKVRLDQSDAKFIDVIHSNGAPFIPMLGFGFVRPIGHVDFFMNGGMTQPGCQIPNDIPKIESLEDLAKFPVELLAFWVCCSHCRSYEYFFESLNKDCKIWGRRATITSQTLGAGTMGITDNLLTKDIKCDADSCIPIGLDTPKFKARGSFLATTRFFSPFCNDPAVTSRISKEIEESGGSKIPAIPKIGETIKPTTGISKPNLPIGGGGLGRLAL